MSISSSFASAEDALSNYLGTTEPFDVRGSQLTLHDDDLAFIFAMERIYCFAMKRRTFKVTRPFIPLKYIFSETSAERLFEKSAALRGRRNL